MTVTLGAPAEAKASGEPILRQGDCNQNPESWVV